MRDEDIKRAVALARAMSDEEIGRLLRPLFCEKHLAALIEKRSTAKRRCLPCAAKRSMNFLETIWSAMAAE